MLVGGQPVRRDTLFAALLEAGGDAGLSELVLDRAVADRLNRRGLAITTADLDRERDRLLDQLAAAAGDPQDPEALLAAFRAQRGLSAGRFDRLLRRNAGLWALAERPTPPGEAAIRRRYDLRFGGRYAVRVIATPDLAAAQRVLADLDAGRGFAAVARERSTDPSGELGGALPLVSLADPAWPQSVRDAVAGMAAGAVSSPVAVEGGFLIVRLEEVVETPAPALEDVRDALAADLVRSGERLAMRRAARDLLQDTPVMVLDPALAEPWARARRRALGPAGTGGNPGTAR
ncbi:MAG: peptidylprolyl isomerase [Planctomycetota bacterium]